MSRGVIALGLVPLLVSAVTVFVRVRSSYYPAGDVAGTELQVRDVGHHPVLLGLFSRDGWNHPGPILFYVLAVPYRLTGGRSIGLLLGALLINGAAILGMALIARRHGGTPLLLLTLLGCGLVVRSFGPDLVRDPWNVSITVLPFGLLVFLTWEMISGSAWASATARTRLAARMRECQMIPRSAITASGAAVTRICTFMCHLSLSVYSHTKLRKKTPNS